MGDVAKVRKNTGGAIVLQCESGNPDLGVMLTPCSQGLIVALPTGREPRHALDSVAVLLGDEKLEALERAVRWTRAHLARSGATR